MFYIMELRQLEMGWLNRMRVLLWDGLTSTFIKFNSNTEIYYYVNNANRFIMAASLMVSSMLVDFVNLSDRRLKKNIVDVSNALQTINTLQVKEFDKKMFYEL